jgi:predicted nucleic acid-binding protein
MLETLYDKRFFLAAYAAERESKLKVRAELQLRRRRYVSAITIHEVYRISLEGEGREVANIRKSGIERDFGIIPVDSDIATESAEIKVSHGRNFPIADAIIAATAKLKKITCFTDDAHIKSVPSVKTQWF